MQEEVHRAGPEAELFYNAFRASPIGIALENLEGQPLFVNPALCSMLGFSEQEMRAKHCVEFSPAEDAEKDWKLFTQLRAGAINQYQIEKRFFRRDGSLIWGQLNISLLDHLSTPLVVAMVQEITDRRMLWEERSHNADIVESLEDAIISTSLEGVIRSWNRGAERMFGYTKEEAIGQSITIIIPAELHDTERDILKRLAAGEPIENYETVRMRKDGTSIFVSITSSLLKDAAGKVIGVSKIVRDITDRKLAEEALSTISRKLIEAHEEERSRIARELHDDINQRISLVAAKLERMQQTLSSSVPNLREEIEDAYKQLSDLGNDVQSLSHRLHSSRLEYLGLAAASKSFLKELSDRRNVEIQFYAHDVPRALPQDVALCLFRVLQEAVQNAIKHSGAGRIQVSLIGGVNQIELRVHDSGSGFAAEEAIKGRGLGLTSMKERLKLVAGELSIESQLQEGTTIRARVPFTPETKSAAGG